MTVRFDWIMDPCDRYLIWDKVEGLPTAYGKDMLIFDTIEEAAGVAALLNEHGNALCKCHVPANGEFIGLPSPNLTLKSQGKFRR